MKALAAKEGKRSKGVFDCQRFSWKLGKSWNVRLPTLIAIPNLERGGGGGGGRVKGIVYYAVIFEL